MADIREQTNAVAKREDFRLETLPPHLFMNFRVVDEHGRMLEMSRNLATLQSGLGKQARTAFQQLAELRASATKEKTAAQRKNQPVSPATAPAETLSSAEKITTWNFEPLPELLEITRGKQSLIGYPALVDKATHCEIEVFDEPAVAIRLHRAGLRRLFALQLKDQLRFLGKNINGLTQMGMQFIKLGTQEELRDQILQASLDAAFLYQPLPDRASEFEKRKNDGKARVGLICNEIARVVQQILTEYQTIQKKLSSIRAHDLALSDMNEQLARLINKSFITDNPLERLKHFPRYLKACSIRIDKCRNDPQRDKNQLSSWHQAAAPYFRFLKEHRQQPSTNDPKIAEYRWQLEELRVSLFAQELRTPYPVSVKRLLKIWDTLAR